MIKRDRLIYFCQCLTHLNFGLNVGLDLSACLKIGGHDERMTRGRIWGESTPDEGAKFHFTLTLNFEAST